MLTYVSIVESRLPEQVLDFDAYVEGRELPSEVAKKKEHARVSAEMLSAATLRGGEVG